MEQVLEILKYVLPSVVTLLTAWYLVKGFLENDQKKRLLELRMKQGELVQPVRLQAYERCLLLMERISLNNLLVRASLPGSSAHGLHALLVGTVRQEFDHNLSQQLYISQEAWELVRSAKEEVLKQLNMALSQLPEEASGQQLAELILENSLKLKHPLTGQAIALLKKEVAKQF
ncbi:MAG TPA: hypothetical protein P5550_05745 [Bacteroidales bacterium]|nr:hypothetical protein [Bacteroidales bacterium]HRZ76901.1 hypothetical protein [Bacteroidales bacterium]